MFRKTIIRLATGTARLVNGLGLRRVIIDAPIAAIFALMVAACGDNGGAFGPPEFVWVDTVTIFADSNANDFSATPVDLVVVYNQELLGKLAQTPANDYFRNSDQLKRDYPGMIESFRWEVVPGQKLFDQSVGMRGSAPLGGFIFANIIAQGEHRVRLGGRRNLQIELKNADFSVGPRVWN